MARKNPYHYAQVTYPFAQQWTLVALEEESGQDKN